MPVKRVKRPIGPVTPIWYDSLAPLGSAVRYIASLSPEVTAVAVYRTKGEDLVLGPHLGSGGASGWPKKRKLAKTSPPSERTGLFPVRDRKGRLLGVIAVEAAPEPPEYERISRIAGELGELWPA